MTAGALHHLALSPASATIGSGSSQVYTAQGRDQFDNPLADVTAATTFTIAPNGSCTGATCTAATAGAHTVTGTDAGKTGTASLQIAPGSLDHIVIAPATATITSGGSQSYTAQGRDHYDNPLGDLTASTTFAIAPNGSCTAAVCGATTAGAHTVTGTSVGASGTASLQVTAGSLDHITISPATAAIANGGSQAYTAQGFDVSNNLIGDVTANTVFTIDAGLSCPNAICTSTKGGTHTVTGTDAGKTATAKLSVDYVTNPGFGTINLTSTQGSVTTATSVAIFGVSPTISAGTTVHVAVEGNKGPLKG